MSKFHSTTRSFTYAFEGIKSAVKKEPNMRVHLLVGSIVLLIASIVGFSLSEWVTLMFAIFFVLILELLNTSIENIVDLVSPDIQPKAKVAKDVSAAAVLLAAAMSVIVGMLLFLPKFTEIGL